MMYKGCDYMSQFIENRTVIVFKKAEVINIMGEL